MQFLLVNGELKAKVIYHQRSWCCFIIKTTDFIPSLFLCWRRKRDSNPRGVAPKRFSRPPRYDRFDIPAYPLLNYNAISVFRRKEDNAFHNEIYYTPLKGKSQSFSPTKTKKLGRLCKSQAFPSVKNYSLFNVTSLPK